MDEVKEEKGFTVKDKRIFSETGDENVTSDEEKIDSSEKTSKTEETGPCDMHDGKPGASACAQLPEINFATFIFSLNMSALVHLGMIEDPGIGQKTKQLPLAKQTIDTLGVLEEKTKGNLTQDEEHLLKNILHDLRLMYVKEMV